ncbi:MAG TPA: histidine kinase [Plantibacter sp.]|uniref:sensor histidine kinase n=1 Tax=unclassified Plantibacter TaxID=2624265 RepID=UPI002D09A6A7|nr:histidine kinase [Plantibacter sp.]
MSINQTPTAMDITDLGRPPDAVARWFASRPRIVDLLMVLASIALQAITLVLAAQRPLWPAVFIVIVASVTLFWRRRTPFLVLCATALVSAGGVLIYPGMGPLSFPFAFALYNLAATRAFPRAAFGYGIGVALPALSALVLFIANGRVFSPLILDPFALIALSLGFAVRNRRQRQAALAELVNQRLENARVVERNRITAEMHDVVAHSISIMIALADGASTGWQKHPERSATALRNLGGVGRTALTDMRRILHLLRTNDVDLAEALHHSGHNLPRLDHLIEVFRSAGLPVRLIRSGTPLPDDPTLSTTVYRIAQEALTNALRYAIGATLVDVRLESDVDSISLTVTDDGHAPAAGAPSQGSGRGLHGIAERAATYAGTSTSGPLPDGGWRTAVTLHLTEESDTEHS